MLADLCASMLQKKCSDIPPLTGVTDIVITSKNRCKFLVDKSQNFKLGDTVHIEGYGIYYVSCLKRNDNDYIYATRTRKL